MATSLDPSHPHAVIPDTSFANSHPCPVIPNLGAQGSWRTPCGIGAQIKTEKNNCFANAFLRLLQFTYPVQKILTARGVLHEEKSNSSDSLFRNLLYNAIDAIQKNRVRDEVYSFYEKLVEEFGSGRYDQQDIDELFCWILNRIPELFQVFSFDCTNISTCTACEESHEIPVVLTTFNVGCPPTRKLGQREAIPLSECIPQFLKSDKVESRCSVKRCDYYEKNSNHVHQYTVNAPPPLLFLVFDRSYGVNQQYPRGRTTELKNTRENTSKKRKRQKKKKVKTTKPYEKKKWHTPIEYDVEEVILFGAKYRVYVTVQHGGSGERGGHYWVHVRLADRWEIVDSLDDPKLHLKREPKPGKCDSNLRALLLVREDQREGILIKIYLLKIYIIHQPDFLSLDRKTHLSLHN